MVAFQRCTVAMNAQVCEFRGYLASEEDARMQR